MKRLILTSCLCLLFVAGTALADWDEGDGDKMHWPQLPDLTPTGMDVDTTWTPLADDWQCSESGPVKDIHLWGSFAGDGLPANGPGSLTFQLSIWSNNVGDSEKPWSRPEELLWTQQFGPGTYKARQVANNNPEDWYDPATQVWLNNDHLQAYQYNFLITDNPFYQVKDTIYWLEVKDIPPTDPDYTFGWKTTRIDLRFMDDAVYWNQDPDRGPIGWTPMKYPQGHEYGGTTLDLAFVITPEPATIMLLGLGGLLLRRGKH